MSPTTNLPSACLSAHILDTRRYAALCENCGGKGAFIHHEPGVGGINAYKATFQAYRITFKASFVNCSYFNESFYLLKVIIRARKASNC